jgi:hypothetical protein
MVKDAIRGQDDSDSALSCRLVAVDCPWNRSPEFNSSALCESEVKTGLYASQELSAMIYRRRLLLRRASPEVRQNRIVTF